jgi:energy-coupling factor transporter ATP-binding protein EcfA2
MLRYPWIRNFHYLAYHHFFHYRSFCDRIHQRVITKLSKKLSPAVLHTADKIAFMIECQLPFFIPLGVGLGVSLAIGKTFFETATWFIPGVVLIIIDMVSVSDIYPYDHIESMNSQILKGRIKPLAVDPQFLQKITDNFKKPKNKSVLLTGAAGSGKNTVIQALVGYIMRPGPDNALKDITVYRLKVESLNAMGASNTSSSFDMKMVTILDTLRALPGKNYLYVENIHTLLDSNSNFTTSLQQSKHNDLVILGTTTELDYYETISRNTTLKNRFNKVAMPECKTADCIRMIQDKYKDVLNYDEAQYALNKADHLYDLSARPFNVMSLLEDVTVHKTGDKKITKKDIDEGVKRWEINHPKIQTPEQELKNELKGIHKFLSEISTSLFSGNKMEALKPSANTFRKIKSMVRSKTFWKYVTPHKF